MSVVFAGLLRRCKYLLTNGKGTKKLTKFRFVPKVGPTSVLRFVELLFLQQYVTILPEFLTTKRKFKHF